jgi:transposase
MIRLTDEHWERIRKHFPEEHIHPERKPVPTRRVLEAVQWILNTGSQWHMLLQSYPNYKTVHRRALHATMARRALLCMDSIGSAGSLFAGSPRRESFGLCSARLSRYPL